MFIRRLGASDFRGVRERRSDAFSSEICFGEKRLIFGTFDTAEEAAHAHDLKFIHYGMHVSAIRYNQFLYFYTCGYHWRTNIPSIFLTWLGIFLSKLSRNHNHETTVKIFAPLI